MALKEYLGATGLTDILTKLKTVFPEKIKATKSKYGTIIPGDGLELEDHSLNEKSMTVTLRVGDYNNTLITNLSIPFLDGSVVKFVVDKTESTLNAKRKIKHFCVGLTFYDSTGSELESSYVCYKNGVFSKSSTYPVYDPDATGFDDKTIDFMEWVSQNFDYDLSLCKVHVLDLFYIRIPSPQSTKYNVTFSGSAGVITTNVADITRDIYTFHFNNTAASTAVAYCNKVARFIPPSERASAGESFRFSIKFKLGEGFTSLNLDGTYSMPSITSITLYDKATAKQTVAVANFSAYDSITKDKDTYILTWQFVISGEFITATIATALNAVIDSASPGFACVYAANELALRGTVKSKARTDEKIPGFASLTNTMPDYNRIAQFVGDFYLPTGGPRWNLEIEVDPGTAYIAVCYLENTTTGAYFSHLIAYCGVGTPTFAAPTVAPAPVAGKVIAFVGTTWTPFVAGVAGVVNAQGVVTTKPRLRIQGYHASNTPTAGLGMHMRLFRIY